MRPYKHGIDYFPLDVDADQDSAIQLIEAKYGVAAFGIWVKLLMRIYRKGYCIPWSERECFILARQIGIDPDTLRAVVSECVAEGLFSAEKLAEHRILTSRAIQERYSSITKRRESGAVPIEHSCCDNGSIGTETMVSVRDNPLKKRREEESKEEREIGALFSRLWEAYPKHTYKNAALSSFSEAINNGQDPEAMIAAAGCVKRDATQSLRYFIEDDSWRDYTTKEPLKQKPCFACEGTGQFNGAPCEVCGGAS